jgi:ring-1,2-phenylacetyl-CoA epoxidase subunit PaaC
MAQQLSPHDAQRQALITLLLQMADDDLMVGQRASEWLGLAPHVEEDVAFASLAQDEIGHATAYYGLLQELGLGEADDLAYLRPAGERVNAVLLELPNGPGTYLSDPHFDWAFTLARELMYDTWEAVRLEHATRSSYAPLSQLAAKVRREEAYHLDHHKVWLEQLAAGGKTPRRRFQEALEKAAAAAGDLADTRPWAQVWEETGILPDASRLEPIWRARLSEMLTPGGWILPPVGTLANGRLGQHTAHLEELLATLSEVRRAVPHARW